MQFDEEIWNRYPAYATGKVNDQLVAQLRAGIAGRLRDHEYVELVGKRIKHFRHLGNHDEAVGSDEWRLIARALCVSEYEALECVVSRDEGDFPGDTNSSSACERCAHRSRLAKAAFPGLH